MKPLRSSLYRCQVRHDRLRPKPYGFKSSTFMFLLELDELDELARRIPILSVNRSNLYSYRDSDHLRMAAGDTRANLQTYLDTRGIVEPIGRIQLLTNLRTLGHIFNPVSFFFVYDQNEEPLAVLAEVHNTYNEQKPFLLTREDFDQESFTAHRPKYFYISPFSQLDETLELKLRFPGDELELHVNAHKADTGNHFFASLRGKQVPLSTAQLLLYSLRFPFITLKVVALIHWHALRIWMKGIPAHRKASEPSLQKDLFPPPDLTKTGLQ